MSEIEVTQDDKSAESIPEVEERILTYWKKIDAFKTCLKNSKGKPK